MENSQQAIVVDSTAVDVRKERRRIRKLVFDQPGVAIDENLALLCQNRALLARVQRQETELAASLRASIASHQELLATKKRLSDVEDLAERLEDERRHVEIILEAATRGAAQLGDALVAAAANIRNASRREEIDRQLNRDLVSALERSEGGKDDGHNDNA